MLHAPLQEPLGNPCDLHTEIMTLSLQLDTLFKQEQNTVSSKLYYYMHWYCLNATLTKLLHVFFLEFYLKKKRSI